MKITFYTYQVQLIQNTQDKLKRQLQTRAKVNGGSFFKLLSRLCHIYEAIFIPDVIKPLHVTVCLY